jgi:hypothetical protein
MSGVGGRRWRADCMLEGKADARVRACVCACASACKKVDTHTSHLHPPATPPQNTQGLTSDGAHARLVCPPLCKAKVTQLDAGRVVVIQQGVVHLQVPG